MPEGNDYKRQFAADVLQAAQSGALPLRDAEKITKIAVALAEMTIQLADQNRMLHGLCEEQRLASEEAAWILANAKLIPA